MSSPSKKRSSSKAVKDASRKQQAKKWSKGKARQKQKELDSEVNAIYAANLSPVQLPRPPQNPQQDAMIAVQTLEESLRGL